MIAFPKNTAQRNPSLLAMARDKPCLIRKQGVCNGDNSTTVAAHSNELAHGKGRGLKANDFYTVWACARCHTWLDGSYSATKEEKQAAFKLAHDRQCVAWENIAVNGVGKEKSAAIWALEELGLHVNRVNSS
jgi:hypothetical protein